MFHKLGAVFENARSPTVFLVLALLFCKSIPSFDLKLS